MPRYLARLFAALIVILATVALAQNDYFPNVAGMSWT